MTSEKQFYVYVHRKATDGSVFYVGKGKGRRAWNKTHRSDYWKRVSDKYGLIVDIVLRFSSEMCALSFEMALIKLYGRENLCNLTDGGEGTSGYKVTDVTKRKISDSVKLITRSEFTRNKIREANLGKKCPEHVKNILSKSNSGIGNGNYDHKKYDFCHETGCFEKMTRFDMQRKYSIRQPRLSLLINGKIKSTKGWSIVC